MYFLGVAVGQRRTLGLFASFFMAVSFWMIVFERTGFRATISVCCVIWTSVFFLLALRHRRWYWYALTGLFLGIGMHTYIAFRLIPLVVLSSFLYHIWQLRKTTQLRPKKIWYSHHWIILTVLISIIIVSPLALYFADNPSYIMGRANEVSVFSQPHPVRLLAESTIANLSIFTFYGDPNWRHNIPTQPLLNYLESILFILGIAIMWRHTRKRKQEVSQNDISDTTARVYILMLLGAMIIPAATTYSPGGIPHSLRIINTAPAVYMFVAVGTLAIFDCAWKTFIQKRKFIISVTGAILVGLIVVTATQYFSPRWGLNRQVAHEYSQDYTNLSIYLNDSTQAGRRVCLINTSSEVDFFTINTPNIFKASSVEDCNILQLHPNLIVTTTNEVSDEDAINKFRKNNWKDVVDLNLGEGGHAITILQEPKSGQ